MITRENSVLVAGFNTRPLAYSLSRAGYEVYAVDLKTILIASQKIVVNK